ncbi:MAG: hypothetical protein R3D00_02195 [Bacteroidia bacterium]
MAKKKLEDYTVEELQKQKKTITTIISIMAGLIIAFGIYFVYSLIAGTWNPTKTLSTVSVAMLVVVISSNAAILSGVSAELKKRGTS